MRVVFRFLAPLLLFTAALAPPALGQGKAGPFTINSSASPCATISVTGQGSVVAKVKGTFSMTLQPELSVQGQSPDNAQATPSTSQTAQSTITAAGSYATAVGSYDTYLLCVTSYVSGTATIYLNTAPTINASTLPGGIASGSVGPVINAASFGANPANTAAQNNTAFTAASASVNAYTETTSNGQAITPPTLYIPFGYYNYSGGLSFTQPMTLRCEPGTVLNYTGSAHAVNFGPPGLTTANWQAMQYLAQDCTWTGGASMTQGLYFNSYLVNIAVIGNTFFNFGNAGSYAVFGASDNWQSTIIRNNFETNDNTKRNGVAISSGDGNSQLLFQNNNFWNMIGFNTGQCGNSSGVGLLYSSIAGHIVHNNFACGWGPAIVLGSGGAASGASYTRIEDNYFEPNAVSPGPMIKFYGAETGLIIDGVYNNLNGATDNPLIAAGDGTSTISNSSVRNVYLPFNSNNIPVVALNNLSGQTGNTFWNIFSGPAQGLLSAVTTPTSVGSNITPWVPELGGGTNSFGTAQSVTMQNTTPAGYGVQLILGGSGLAGSGAPVTLATSNASLLIAITYGFNATAAISDSAGNSWTSLPVYGAGNQARVAIQYVCGPIVSSSDIFTVTGGSFPAAIILAFSGTATSSCFDTPQQNGNGTLTASPFQTGSITPTAGDVVIAAAGTNGGFFGFTNSIDSGFTLSSVSPSASSGLVLGAYLLNAANSALNPTFTTNNGSTQVAAIAAFKAASGSIVNQNSPAFVLSGAVFNGSASVSDTWTEQGTIFNVANGASQLQFTHSGSTGLASVSFPAYATAANCAAVGTAANPSVVTCGTAAAGLVYCDVAASAGTCTVNTSAVTANSEVSITPNAADGTTLSKTCNAAPTVVPFAILASKSAGVSFTINMPTETVNGSCFEYTIVN